MRNLKRPEEAAQKALFDTESCGWWHTQLDPGVFRRLDEGMEGMMRRSILRLLPAEELGRNFHVIFGRPSKELYAVCGLMLLAEFKDWTVDETAEAWCLNAGVQYALNLPRDRQSLCPRTVDNYRRMLRESDAAQEIFETVTAGIIRELGIEIKKQRLDSTHVLSDMAKFGRLKLLAVTLKRFLTQLKRHHSNEHAALPAELRERYTAAESRLFGGGTKRAQPYEESIQQVAQDMGELMARFGENDAITARSSYAALVRAFNEHCEVTFEEPIEIKSKAEDDNGQSSQVMQNPSDPGAGYSGHKGAGYQAQFAQAYDHGEDAPGIITACLPQNAGESDSAAVEQIHQQQERMGTAPQSMLADGAYGSQDNVEASAARGVTLISPAAGRTKIKADPHRLTSPLDLRRVEQETETWKKSYRARSGIEGLNSGMKRSTGMRRLRVRGTKAVGMSIYLKTTGWNVLTAAKINKSRARKAGKASKAARRLQCGALMSRTGPKSSSVHLRIKTSAQFPRKNSAPPKSNS